MAISYFQHMGSVASYVNLIIAYLFVGRTFRVAGELQARSEALIRLNDQLKHENEIRRETQAALEESRNALEDRVRERTNELASSEARLAEAQNLAKLGIWERDADSNDIRCFNQTSLLFGSAEVTDSVPLDVLLGRIDEKERQAATRPIDDALATGKPAADMIFRIKAEDGQVRVLHSQARIIRDESNQPLRLEGIVQDITVQTELEENLLQAQKMEALGKLTGGIAHDINNILGVVLGNLELLAEDASDKVAKRLQTAVKATLRGSELANGLLAFSRRKPLESEVVNLNTVISRTQDILQRALRENIEFEACFADEPCITRLDIGGLETALLNLAVNARDAMPNGGRLTIATRLVKLDGSTKVFGAEPPRGEFVKLEIEDTGTGISENDLSRIFDPFYTTKEVGKGTGLGLSQVYGFVSQSSGFLNVRSNRDQGTKFEVYLPVVSDEVTAEQPTEKLSEASGEGERILIVEDDADVRELSVDLLTGLGYTVVAAADGAEAVAILEKSEDFDLLFTDVVMPAGISGPDLAEIAAAKHVGLKVMFTSGYSDATFDKLGINPENVNFISKPYRLEELSHHVRRVFDS